MIGNGLSVDGEKGEVTYEGRKMRVTPKRFGRGYVLHVDGRKIRVSEDQLVLMYTYFSVMFKSYSSEMEA